MMLSQIKSLLPTLDHVSFVLENGTKVPEHFHVTEVGFITKHFIDCGGTLRNEKSICFQLWHANDFDRKLKPQKLLNIITLSEKMLDLEDTDIEVEYQGETIGKYALAFDGVHFVLQNKTTACLAEDACGIPVEKKKISLSELPISQSTCCTPGSGCC